ncbi:MAG: DUF1232 domain-containing protein [Firmicutes bacterium]|nr:DUF1232 domain-containing protein [Bacillota bacterium]
MEEYRLEDLKHDLMPILKRMPAYAKLTAGLAKDPRIAKSDKAKLAAGLGYLASPIDLIPGIIPILGQLDDILAVLIAVNNVLSSSPKEIIEPHLAEAGLTYAIVDKDIVTIKRVLKDISVTLVKKTGRGLLKAGRYIGKKMFGPKSTRG